jgi:Lon protease-like protein
MRRITRLPYAAEVPVPLPLFPLNAVLVPGLVLPLHIFEPRYRELVEELLDNPIEDAREFGIVAVREGHDVDRDGILALYPVGTAAVLRQAERLEDGRFDIVTTGSRRFRIASIDTAAALIRGEVEFLEDVTDPGDVMLAEQVAIRFAAYRIALSGQVVDEDAVTGDVVDELPDDPTVLSYLVTAAMVLAAPERQELLAAETTAARLTAERALLRRETGLIAALGAVPAIDIVGAAPSIN